MYIQYWLNRLREVSFMVTGMFSILHLRVIRYSLLFRFFKNFLSASFKLTRIAGTSIRFDVKLKIKGGIRVKSEGKCIIQRPHHVPNSDFSSSKHSAVFAMSSYHAA